MREEAVFSEKLKMSIFQKNKPIINSPIMPDCFIFIIYKQSTDFMLDHIYYANPFKNNSS